MFLGDVGGMPRLLGCHLLDLGAHADWDVDGGEVEEDLPRWAMVREGLEGGKRVQKPRKMSVKAFLWWCQTALSYCWTRQGQSLWNVAGIQYTSNLYRMVQGNVS